MIRINWGRDEGEGRKAAGVEVWRWDGRGWNVPVPQSGASLRHPGAEPAAELPAQPGWYHVRYRLVPANAAAFDGPVPDAGKAVVKPAPDAVHSAPAGSLFTGAAAPDAGDTRAAGRHPAPFRTAEGTVWGYIADNGRTAIEPAYEYAEPFQANGLAVVQQGGKSGLIDPAGKLRVKPVYEVILPFSEGRAVASDGKGYLLIDETGASVTGNRRYAFLNSLENGRALFTPSGGTETSYGYLDRDGREVIPARYPEAGDFAENRALVKLPDGGYALIDPQGQILHAYSYPFVGNPGDGLLAYQQEENGKYGYIDEAGAVVVAPRFTSALPFEEGRAVVNTAEDYGSAFGLIDRTGRFVIPPEYADVQQLGEGVVALGTPIRPQEPYRGLRFRLASGEDGRMLNPGPLTDVSRFSEGYASVSDGTQTYWVDRNGRRADGLPAVPGSGTLSFSGKLVRADVDLRTAYYDRAGKRVWQENKLIPLRPPYAVAEHLFKPDPGYLVYYPSVRGISDESVSAELNRKLKEWSIPDDPGAPEQRDYSYTGDFDSVFYRKNLLVLELNGYRMPFGAAHGMPSRIYAPINLRSGKVYTLSDLFKPGAPYTQRLSEIVSRQIANDPQYSYVFPDSFKGIAPDQSFYVDRDALYLVFAPYEIAPYAAGFPVFRIPFAEIMGLISTEGDFWQSFH